jgi:hypothetical protein
MREGGDDARDDGNEGARKTGAVWDACDRIRKSLPRGNRSAMRRELLVWSKDCIESICEFEGMLSSSPSSRNDHSCGDEDEDEDEEDDEAEESYAESEMAVARASVNVMKCSKNVLGLILAACECVGERADTYSMPSPADIHDDGVYAESTTTTTTALRYVTDLHGMARSVGEGVTDLGVLLYPPLDFSASPSTTVTASTDYPREGGTADDGGGDDDRGGVVPRLGRTALGAKLECQLRAILECVTSIARVDDVDVVDDDDDDDDEAADAATANAATSSPSTSRVECLPKEVMEEADRLTRAVRVRSREVEEAFVVVDPTLRFSRDEGY